MCLLLRIGNPCHFRLLRPFIDEFLKRGSDDEQGDLDTLVFSAMDKSGKNGIYLAVDEKQKIILGYLLLSSGLEPDSLCVVQSSIKSGEAKKVYRALVDFCKKNKYTKIQWITNRKDANEQIWAKAIGDNRIRKRANIMEVSINGTL